MLSPSDPNALLLDGRFDEALLSVQVIEERRPLTANEQVLLAELLSLTGDVDSAVTVAQRVIKQPVLTVSQRCRLRHVLGLSYFRKGENDRGTENYLAGIALAEQHGELADECRLRVNLFRNQLNWQGPHQAAADLAILRRKVLNLAEPSVAAGFQLALTELAAKLGLLPRARKHLETARALVSRTEDKAIYADLKMIEVAVAALEANFGDALQHALELEAIVEESGFSGRFTIPINLGHLLTIAARFDDALTVLERSRGMRTFSGGGQVAMLDTLMQLRVYQGHLNEASFLAESIQQLLERTQANDSYFGLWHLVTRVKWLYRLGHTEEGLRLALDSAPRIKRMADRNLLERILLLAAEGFGHLGNSVKGADLIAAVWQNNPEPSLDVLAEASRIAGRLTSAENPNNAIEHFRRAKNILTKIGNLAAVAEVQADLSAVSATSSIDDVPTAPTGATSRVETAAMYGPAASMASRVATLIEVGSHARSLAEEALSLVVDTGAILHASVVAVDGTDRRELLSRYAAPDYANGMDDHPDTVRISLGTDRSRKYELLALPRSNASARLTLLSVERLVHGALALARARQIEREHAALWPEQPEQQLGLLCSSERMLDLVKTIRRVAGSNVTVLLTGETGVGKELFAKALHQASSRSEKTFLPFNCTTVARDMFDSQLFGHRRGSFTGAHEDSSGVIRAAEGGTLFLDEIGEMSLDVQPKLLRFLESGEIQPLGDPKPKLVDVRVVAATNANLDQLVSEGRFREDLFYRLNVIRINIPPLRERREEIPALVEHFLERHGRELQKPMLRLADETLEYLVLYRWPGNVRQLANEIRRMVAMAEPGSVLMPAHLSDDIVASRRTIPAGQLPRGFSEVLTRIDQPLAAAVEHVERAAIQRALSMTDGHLDEAARILGLSRKGLYLKRQRLGID